MTKEKLKAAITYLENYASDLGFQISHGVDFVSYCTDSTPEFENEEKAEEYLSRIESLITELKQNYED